MSVSRDVNFRQEGMDEQSPEEDGTWRVQEAVERSVWLEPREQWGEWQGQIMQCDL